MAARPRSPAQRPTDHSDRATDGALDLSRQRTTRADTIGGQLAREDFLADLTATSAVREQATDEVTDEVVAEVASLVRAGRRSEKGKLMERGPAPLPAETAA
jgi:hypothetical protein